MKDTLTLFNRDDFRQRYRNNYGFLTLPDSRKLVYIQDVNSRMVTFITQDNGDTYYANAGANVWFDFIPIVRGWYSTTDKPIFLTRVPARQYCRGISQSNTNLLTPQSGVLNFVELSLEVLSQIFETPATYSLEDFENNIVNFLLLGKIFCISGEDVYFFNQKVGKYSNRVITLETMLVKQELSDVIRRMGLPLTVEVKHADA